jgi:hypothetical protein
MKRMDYYTRNEKAKSEEITARYMCHEQACHCQECNSLTKLSKLTLVGKKLVCPACEYEMKTRTIVNY